MARRDGTKDVKFRLNEFKRAVNKCSELRKCIYHRKGQNFGLGPFLTWGRFDR
jgi:hypothetical protein